MKLLAKTSLIILICAMAIACDDEEHFDKMIITSPAFVDGAYIPARHTCFSTNVSFPVVINDIPVNTESLALVMEQRLDEGKITHWVVWSIPANVHMLDEGKLPGQAKEGINSWGNPNYAGPCPERDDTSKHKYYTTVWALDYNPDLQEGATAAELKKAINGHILGVGELMGRYRF